MKCRTMRHFIKVYTACLDKKRSSEKETRDPSKYIMDHAKLIVSNQKEESIGA